MCYPHLLAMMKLSPLGDLTDQLLCMMTLLRALKSLDSLTGSLTCATCNVHLLGTYNFKTLQLYIYHGNF